MRTVLLFCFFCLCSSLGHTHETNEAFFTYIQKENTVEIEVEFPWTMRNALIEFNPLLGNTATKIEFENTFSKYIIENIILKDKNGKLFQYQEFRELETTGHSHQNSYLLIFKGTNLFEVTNTTMFNVNDNQVNYNSIAINSSETTFKTKKNSNQFYINESTTTNYGYFLLLIIPLIYGINYFNKSV
jgi:hypothetical protein